MAVAGRSGAVRAVKALGRVRDLEERLPKRFAGATGIAHTRWATHGAPSDENAHPHLDAAGEVAVVHNGIIDNAAELRARLVADGVVFTSETDTEVLAHLIARSAADTLEARVREALSLVDGTYGIAVLHAGFPDRIVAARNGSPVVLGHRRARDVRRLRRGRAGPAHPAGGHAGGRRDGHPHGGRVPHVHHRGLAHLGRADHRRVGRRAGRPVRRWAATTRTCTRRSTSRPDAVDRVLRGRIDDRFATVHLGGLGLDAREARAVRRVKIIGCGSAYHAGMIGAQMIEELARIPADAEPASEFRYRNPVVDHDTLYIAVSQSGETYDTLAAVQELKRKGARVLGVVNVVGSAIAREADGGIYVHAGPEVCVVSTKCFTNTAVAFALLALHLGRVRDLSVSDGRRIIAGLRRLPEQIARSCCGTNRRSPGWRRTTGRPAA